MVKEKSPNEGVEIISRTHRMAQALYCLVNEESNASGNSINSEINSLIRDGLRFRSAKVTINLE